MNGGADCAGVGYESVYRGEESVQESEADGAPGSESANGDAQVRDDRRWSEHACRHHRGMGAGWVSGDAVGYVAGDSESVRASRHLLEVELTMRPSKPAPAQGAAA